MQQKDLQIKSIIFKKSGNSRKKLKQAYFAQNLKCSKWQNKGLKLLKMHKKLSWFYEKNEIYRDRDPFEILPPLKQNHVHKYIVDAVGSS